MTKQNRTIAHIAIYRKDEHAYGFGCELLDANSYEDYFIASMYLPFTEYPNIRQVLHHMIPMILAEVPDDHTSVTFYANLKQFRPHRDLVRKNQRFAIGKTLIFKEMQQVRRTAIMLAIDALTDCRRNSITERLER
ncbi:MAG: hypothetical protein ABGX20_05600 [Bacillus sp. (in: firmicutes)]